MLDNSAALKKLAALYPELSATTLAAAASDMAAADSSHSRKEGKRTAASSGGEIGAGRLGVPFDLAAEPVCAARHTRGVAREEVQHSHPLGRPGSESGWRCSRRSSSGMRRRWRRCQSRRSQ